MDGVSRLLLIGCGRMGSILLERWAEAFPDIQFTVITPEAVSLQGPKRVSFHASASEIPTSYVPDWVVIAVKPQQFEEALAPYAERDWPKAVFLSIAAGKSFASLQKALGAKPFIRAMPNTPARIGLGATALCANDKVSGAQKNVAEQLFNALGKSFWLDHEAQMHAATALSGSGPAYGFLFLEALTKAGTNAGLPEPLAERMALQTLLGSVELASRSNEPLAKLREEVTSPGGTTEAALRLLMGDKGILEPVDKAVAAAAERSKMLEN